MQLVDLNSDGLFDVFSHDPLERDSQQIVFFMNTGQNFENIYSTLKLMVGTFLWILTATVNMNLHFYSIRGQWEDPSGHLV